MARWILRVAVTASVLLVLAHFAFTLKTFHAITLESVQFAEFGLPLLILGCAMLLALAAVLAERRQARATARIGVAAA